MSAPALSIITTTTTKVWASNIFIYASFPTKFTGQIYESSQFHKWPIVFFYWLKACISFENDTPHSLALFFMVYYYLLSLAPDKYSLLDQTLVSLLNLAHPCTWSWNLVLERTLLGQFSKHPSSSVSDQVPHPPLPSRWCLRQQSPSLLTFPLSNLPHTHPTTLLRGDKFPLVHAAFWIEPNSTLRYLSLWHSSWI